MSLWDFGGKIFVRGSFPGSPRGFLEAKVKGTGSSADRAIGIQPVDISCIMASTGKKFWFHCLPDVKIRKEFAVLKAMFFL